VELGVQRLHLLGSFSPTLRTPEPCAFPESPRYFEDAFETQAYPEGAGGPEDPVLSTSVSPQSSVTSPLSCTAASSVTPDYTAVTAHTSAHSLDPPRGHSLVSEDLGIRKVDTLVYDTGNLTQFSWNPDTQATTREASFASNHLLGSYEDHVGCRETDI
jgi:hypothetical protein